MIYYKPDFIPQSIILIGGGGTGSRLIPSLAQLVRTQLRKFNPLAFRIDLPIYIIDGDVVEEKNLMRQLFVRPDVGRNKAVVLAERYSMAFGIPITPIPHFLNRETAADVREVRQLLAGHMSKNALVIFAVDSADARREILTTLLTHTHLMNPTGAGPSSTCGLLIDAGNEDDFGQVKISGMAPCLVPGVRNRAELDRHFYEAVVRKPITDLTLSYLPLSLAYYRDLGSSAQEQSCAELPQTLAINQMMATLILSFVQNVLLLKAMTYDMIRFSLKDGATSSAVSLRSVADALTLDADWAGNDLLCSQNRDVNNTSASYNRYLACVRGPILEMSKESRKVYKDLGFTIDKDGNPVPPAPVAQTPGVDTSNPPPLVKVEKKPEEAKKIPRRKRPVQSEEEDLDSTTAPTPAPVAAEAVEADVAVDIPAEIPRLVRIS